ncbi:hypothetical protein T08_13789 [Trichinella sp. T8]|nr:hypothetical protein T08_13789 [Trichinella sp. T8]
MIIENNFMPLKHIARKWSPNVIIADLMSKLPRYLYYKNEFQDHEHCLEDIARLFSFPVTPTKIASPCNVFCNISENALS